MLPPSKHHLDMKKSKTFLFLFLAYTSGAATKARADLCLSSLASFSAPPALDFRSGRASKARNLRSLTLSVRSPLLPDFSQMLSSSLSSSGAAARPAARSSSSRRTSGRSLALAPRAGKKADGPSVAIVGVTGAVGQEFLRVRKDFTSRAFFFFSLSTSPVASLPVIPIRTAPEIKYLSTWWERRERRG